tara:strand:+ start:4293 stop:4868 length:576 start_codon:yes stop_codon:yes gene_type:complete
MAKAFKNYADFNTVTVTGRIHNAEIPQGRDFLAVTVITNLETEGGQMTVTFNNSNGLKSLFEKGFLPVGRVVTVTGRINGVTEVYQDNNGDLLTLKYPRIHLTGVQILDGGLGPMPESSRNASRKITSKVIRREAMEPKVDPTPSLMDDVYSAEMESAEENSEQSETLMATPPSVSAKEALEELNLEAAPF